MGEVPEKDWRISPWYLAGTSKAANFGGARRTSVNVVYIVKRPALGGPSLLHLVEVARIELASGSTQPSGLHA